MSEADDGVPNRAAPRLRHKDRFLSQSRYRRLAVLDAELANFHIATSAFQLQGTCWVVSVKLSEDGIGFVPRGGAAV
jgi:hypothetical protein